MQRITHTEIQKLAHKNNFPSVSIYASLKGDYYDIRDRFLRMAKETRHRLEDYISYDEARALTSPLYESIHNRESWEHEDYDQSAVVFVDKTGIKRYVLPDKEPESVEVGRGFRIVPLFGQLTKHGRFYSLLLTMKSATLVLSDVAGIRTVATVNAQETA